MSVPSSGKHILCNTGNIMDCVLNTDYNSMSTGAERMKNLSIANYQRYSLQVCQIIIYICTATKNIPAAMKMVVTKLSNPV